MKRLIVALTIISFSPAFAVPTIEFSPAGGGWSYDGGGRFYFTQNITVDRGLGSNTDALALAGARVYIPELYVSGSAVTGYSVAPVAGNATIAIKDAADNVLLSGVLGEGDLFPFGEGGFAYMITTAEVTNVRVTDAGSALGSDALAYISRSSGAVDIQVTFNGADGGFQNMLENGLERGDGFSGAMTAVNVRTPAPAAVLLGAIGLGMVGWLRKLRTL